MQRGAASPPTTCDFDNGYHVPDDGSMTQSRARALVTLPVVALVLASCGDSEDSETAASQESGDLEVVVGFYPLEFATNRIVGDLGTVETLTSPGVDPHDTELSPQSVAGVKSADVVIYSANLQSSVDAAVEAQAADHSFDVNEAADLIEAGDTDEHDHGDEEGHSDEEGEHADEDGHTDEEGHSDEEGEHAEEKHDHGGTDPHFWLDPARMAGVSQAIANELAQVDPDNADTYQANAEELVTELTTLKEEYDTGLASCAQEDLITTHEAFGYIAEPYGFHQIGITGLAPDSEPSAARLAEVSGIVEEVDATTVYSEILLGSDIAETVANETGAQVLVLDPIEGVTDASPGEDYVEIMRANLENLREGQGCS